MRGSRTRNEADIIDTGHLPALTDPDALVTVLDGYREDLGLASRPGDEAPLIGG